jgi:hypothetical protein
VRYADDFIIGFEHHRPTASRRSVRISGANPVAVGVVAVTAVRTSANCGRANSGRTDRCRTDTVAPIAVAAPIASAAHCDSAASARSSNCDRSAAVAATAPIGTSAAPSLGIIGDQAGGEQNDSGKRNEDIAEHDGNLSNELSKPAREITALSTREVDVDQRI